MLKLIQCRDFSGIFAGHCHLLWFKLLFCLLALLHSLSSIFGVSIICIPCIVFCLFFSVGFLHRCPVGRLWLCWHGDFLAPEESASSPIATFMASVPSNYYNNNWHCVLDSVIVCSFVEKGYYFVHQNCAPCWISVPFLYRKCKFSPPPQMSL